MKRLLPVLIAVALIAALFSLLPKSERSLKQLKTLNDLNGCKVGIQTGLNYENYLAEACPKAEPVFFSEYRSMFPALQQGKVDAMLTESISFVIEKVEYKGLAAIEEPLNFIECGIGVSNNGIGKSLLPQLNTFIAEYRDDGTYEEMADYWLENYDRGNTSVDKSGITGENGVVVFADEAAWEPMCFVGSGGDLQGFDVDFIYRFCRKYGYKPEIIPLEYDAMSAALASGKCSVAMGLVENQERAEAVNFTDSFITYDVIAVYYQLDRGKHPDGRTAYDPLLHCVRFLYNQQCCSLHSGIHHRIQLQFETKEPSLFHERTVLIPCPYSMPVRSYLPVILKCLLFISSGKRI